jgi:tubulin--tyrosine ligase
MPFSSDYRFLRTYASQDLECLTISKNQSQHFYASIACGDTYIQPLILSALASRLAEGSYTLLSSECTLPSSKDHVLHIKSYEALPFDDVMAHPETCLVNAYIIRKALVRTPLISVTSKPSLKFQDP